MIIKDSIECENNYLIRKDGTKKYLKMPRQDLRLLSHAIDSRHDLKAMITCHQCGYKCFEGTGIRNRDAYTKDAIKDFIKHGK